MKWRIETETHVPGKTVHDPPGPGVRPVIEGVLHETAIPDTQRFVRYEQVPVHDHIRTDSEACPARAGRIVELKVVRDQVAHGDMMLRATVRCVEPFGRALPVAHGHVNLKELVSYEQGVLYRLGQLFSTPGLRRTGRR